MLFQSLTFCRGIDEKWYTDNIITFDFEYCQD